MVFFEGFVNLVLVFEVEEIEDVVKIDIKVIIMLFVEYFKEKKVNKGRDLGKGFKYFW